jgi:UDP-N-acetylglucosamine 3-dehydrogenase
MLKIGLIGAGMMGQVHARAYANLPQAQLVAVADLRAEKANEVASFTGARVLATLDELLAAIDVDVIDICLSTPLHAAHTIQALETGKHVFCEKPITLTMDQANLVRQAARKARGKFTVGHVVRFFPEYARAHDLLLKGEVGEPKVIHTLRGGGFPLWNWNNWMGDLYQSGGVALDLACHEFDWLRWCLGEVTRVFARGLAYTHLAAGQSCDHALIVTRFASGALAHTEVTWAVPSGGPFMTQVEVAGSQGILRFDSQSSMPIRGYWDVKGASTAVPESPLAVSPFQAELEHFLNCILEDRPPLVGVDDAVKALELSLAALDSIKTGQPVTLGGAQ